MSPAVAKAEAATRGAKTDQSDAPATKKATGKDKGDDALGLDAIVAAAADELRSSSGSAEGSPAPEAKPPARAGKGDKPKAEKPDERPRADAKKRKKDDAPEEEPVELGPNGKPKLPRPEGIAPCPRCHSEETKFCYYNNYNVKQPRYFCRGCQRYWTAGGMLRNVPVGAGRRKNKNGADALARPGASDAAAALSAGRVLAGVADAGRHPLGGLARAAAAAACATRERRDGSSDGSATEAEAEDASAYGRAAADFASRWPAAFGAARAPSSGEGSADGGAGLVGSNAKSAAAGMGIDFAAMFGGMAGAQGAYAGMGPFFAAQAAAQAAQARAAGSAASGWPGAASASAGTETAFAHMAQMAQMAVSRAGLAASLTAADAAGGAQAQLQQQQAAQAYAAAQAFAAARGGLNPFFGARAPAGGSASPVPGSPSAASAAAPHKPTASAFSAMPSHLQRQLSTTQSLPAAPGDAAAAASASGAETDTAADAAVPGAPAAAAPGPGFRAPDATASAASAGTPNWAAMLSVMGPAMAAMQQYQSAAPMGSGLNPNPPGATQAAAAAAAAGFSPHQMQQIAAALASGGYNPFAASFAAPAAAPAPAAEKAAGSDGSGEDSALPSTAREPSAPREFRDVGDHPGAKRFKVSEDRAGHAG